MEFTLCIRGLFAPKIKDLTDLYPILQTFDDSDDSVYHWYFTLDDIEQVEFFATNNNVTIEVEETDEACIEGVSNGTYDLASSNRRTNFPSPNYNLTEGYSIDSSLRRIFTLVEQKSKKERVQPNFMIYSAEVYWLLLMFFIIWTVLNISTALLTNSKLRFTLVKLFKKVLINMFDVTTAHIGVINSESSSQMLQLALVVSVTLVLSIWGACFSNQNIHISSGHKVYNTYKSLSEDPPDLILIDQASMDQVDSGTFETPSAQKYLEKLKNRFMTFDILGQEISAEEPKLDLTTLNKFAAVSSENSCGYLKYFLNVYASRFDHFDVFKRVDPAAKEHYRQRVISSSIWTKSGAKKMLQTVRTIDETALDEGAMNLVRALYLQVPKTAHGAAQAKQTYIGRCLGVEPEEELFYDVTLKSMETVFCFFSWVVVFLCLVLVAEYSFYRAKMSLKERKNRVRPFKATRTTKTRAKSALV